MPTTTTPTSASSPGSALLTVPPCWWLDRRVVVGSAGRLMRALLWIAENTWEACVDRAARSLPADAEVTLLHVAPSDVEELARRRRRRALLGRRPPPPPGPPLRAIADEEAQARCSSRRGTGSARPAELDSRRGRRRARGAWPPARAQICSSLARDGRPRAGPAEPRSAHPVRRRPRPVRRCCSCGPSRRRASTTIKPPPHRTDTRAAHPSQQPLGPRPLDRPRQRLARIGVVQAELALGARAVVAVAVEQRPDHLPADRRVPAREPEAPLDDRRPRRSPPAAEAGAACARRRPPRPPARAPRSSSAPSR